MRLYYIVVSNQTETNPSKVIDKLGLKGFNSVEETNFLAINKSQDLFIGQYEDNLIIACPDLTYPFFSSQPTDFESTFVQAFPEAEITALIQNDTADHFGFALIDHGKRIRIMEGGDGEINLDIGDPLPEEKAILAGPIFEPDELDEMREEMEEEEVQRNIKIEAGYRTMMEIPRRYFGDLIDSGDIFDIKLTRYQKL